MTVLEEMARWYAVRCDGQWEHDHGVRIESCDNPGWWVKIDLAGTPLFDRPFPGVSRGDLPEGYDPGADWIRCYIEGTTFHGAGDPAKLEEILRVFLAWANG